MKQLIPNNHRLTAQLIRAWRDSGDTAARDRILVSYAPMVKYLAACKIRVPWSSGDLDDLVSCGLIALLRAIDSFEPQKGASFDSYAWTRVSGAIVDELRRMDWAPRSLRRQQRRITSARETLEHRTARKPTNLELATEIGVSGDELERQLRALHTAETVSLQTPVRDGGEDGSSLVEFGNTLAAVGTHSQDPEAWAIANEQKRVMRDAIRLLSEQEQTVLALVYVHGLMNREAASVIGVTESRVSQVLAKVRLKLKQHMDHYDSVEFSDLAA
jgi:RNA polymerase sigma factor FliA